MPATKTATDVAKDGILMMIMMVVVMSMVMAAVERKEPPPQQTAPFPDVRGLNNPPTCYQMTGTNGPAAMQWRTKMKKLFADVATHYKRRLHRDFPDDRDLIDRERAKCLPVNSFQMGFGTNWRRFDGTNATRQAGPDVRRSLE